MDSFVRLTSSVCSWYIQILKLHFIPKWQGKYKQCFILSVINQTQDKAININDNFWTISTLQYDKKSHITCLQFSYTIKLSFPYDIIYLPDGCEANVISFVLPSNNKLHVETSIGTPQYKLGFNRYYSKIDNFSLLQSLNLSSLTYDKNYKT